MRAALQNGVEQAGESLFIPDYTGAVDKQGVIYRPVNFVKNFSRAGMAQGGTDMLSTSTNARRR